MMAGTASLVGDWLTRAYETVFSLPNEMQYAQSGMLFGQYLVDASTHFEITDSRLAANFSEFWQGCVLFAVISHRVGLILLRRLSVLACTFLQEADKISCLLFKVWWQLLDQFFERVHGLSPKSLDSSKSWGGHWRRRIRIVHADVNARLGGSTALSGVGHDA